MAKMGGVMDKNWKSQKESNDMKKYIELDWPEIQDYMTNPGYPEEVGFDPQRNKWYIPEKWYETDRN